MNDTALQINIINPCANIDKRYGVWGSKAAALAGVPTGVRDEGLTVGVIDNGSLTEYWWKGGTNDSNLVLKTLGVDAGSVTAQDIVNNDSNFTIISGTNVQDSLDSIDNKLELIETEIELIYQPILTTDESLYIDDAEIRSNIAQITETFTYDGSTKTFTLVNDSVDIKRVLINRSTNLFLLTDYTIPNVNEVEINESYNLFNGDLIRITYNYIITI